MFGIFCGKLQLPVVNRRLTKINSVFQLGFLQNNLLFTLRSLSSKPSLCSEEKGPLTAEQVEQKPLKKQSSFTISYLVNSYGFAPESAESVAKRISLTTPEKADVVLGILRDYGFSDAHISKLICKRPQLLLASPERTLVPKLEFMRSIGIPSSKLGRVVAWNTDLLSRSLEKHIIPCYDVLRSVLVYDEKVSKTFLRMSMIAMELAPKNLAVNVSILKEIGMPESMISNMLISQPMTMSENPEKFGRVVRKVIEIGFEPSKYKFVAAVQVISVFPQKTWEHKMGVYGRWGLSEDEIWSAFKKDPRIMLLSEKKIMDMMDVLVNQMGWQSAIVMRYPSILSYSLEKRIIPRCLVIRTLLLKGLIKGEFSISTLLHSPEKYFLNSFVMKYQQEIPQLSSIFQGEYSILELGVGFEEKSVAKNL